MNLTTAQIDRVAGTMLGLACGDALGAGYEFQPRVPYTDPIEMNGGGDFGWAPGEWTDDTAMAMCIAKVAAQGLDLRSAEAQDQIAQAWLDWSADATDVGIQTSHVFRYARSEGTAAALLMAAQNVHEESGRSAGNGSLMRTAPVALAYLDDVAGLVEAARAISLLTHFEEDAGDACVLWCLAIRHAILHGEFAPMSEFLIQLPEVRRQLWAARIAEAEAKQSHQFPNNGWVVTAFQAAWSAIVQSGTPADMPALRLFPAQHFHIALERAVRCGGDTDTVAAIAGSLLGARWGSTAVPSTWYLLLHGYPDATHADLVAHAVQTAMKGNSPTQIWPPATATHTPQDEHNVLDHGQMHLHTNFSDEICAITLEIPEGHLTRKGGAWVPDIGVAADEAWTSRAHSLSSDPGVLEQSLHLIRAYDEYEFRSEGAR